VTEYTDLPRANMLYGESERTQAAVSNLDGGGGLLNFTVGPPPAPTNQPPPVVPTITTGVSVTITLERPASDALLADLRAWLVQRQAAINEELATLEINNPPPPPGPPSRRG
jgi:hypothetical protein